MTFEVPALAAGFASKFDTIGPYVGFGSLIAVVAMAVLVFSQGRELQRLREWAGTAPERLDELEQRFEEDLQRPRGQTLAPHPGAQQQRAPGQPPIAGVPGRPGVPGAPQRPPAVGASMAGGVATAATAAGAAGAAAGGATPKPTPKPTPPGGGGAHADGPGAGPPTRVVAAAAPGGPRAASAAGIAAKTAREREAAAAASPRRTPAQIIGVAVVLIVVLVGVLFALGILGGSDSPTAERNAVERKQQKDASKKKAKPYSAPATSVVVLNGSGTNGLAKGASGILDEKRFNTGPSNDFTVNGQRSQQALSTIAYRAGHGNKDAALDIAKALKLPTSRVKPMTSDVRMAVSGSPKIIVILGLDYAAKQNGGVAPADTATTPPADQQQTNGTGGATGTGSGTTTGTTDGTGAGAGAVDPATGGATGDTTGGATSGTDGSGGVTTP